MRICCDRLENLLNNAGRDDFAVLAKRTGEYRMFVIQSRACRLEDEAKLQALPRDVELPRPLHVVTQIAIQWCPFCGSTLQELITADPDAFDRICEEHTRFVM